MAKLSVGERVELGLFGAAVAVLALGALLVAVPAFGWWAALSVPAEALGFAAGVVTIAEAVEGRRFGGFGREG